MKFLESIISFLLGVFWALLIISAFFTFEMFYPLGLLNAIVMTILSSSFWLLIIIFLEIANVQFEKLKEARKQTKILESIQNRLNE